jgi:hypothetical protein
MLSWDYRGIGSCTGNFRELRMTTLLADLPETGSFKATFDFAKG